MRKREKVKKEKVRKVRNDDEGLEICLVSIIS
jgi:hypothetical protein